MKKTLSILLSVLLLLPLMIVVDAADVTIDGNFDDSIWTDIPWIHVDSANGYWQSLLEIDETRDQNYDVKFRADDENLYVAVKTNFAPVGTDEISGNGKGTTLRFWTFVEGNTADGEAYTKWNYLVDYAYKPSGDVLTFKGSAVTTNAETAGVEADSVTGEDSWSIELKIPFTAIDATDSVSVYTSISSPLAPAEGEEIDTSTNNALYYPSYGDREGNAAAPYGTWNTSADLDIIFDNIKVGNEFVDYLPYKSIRIDSYGDSVAGEMIILSRVGDNTTIGEVSAVTFGSSLDYNWYYMVVVDADGLVTQTSFTSGAKDNVEIPEGGYVLLPHYDIDSSRKSVFFTIEVGDQITLHNVDLDALAEGQTKVALPYSAFTINKAGEGVVNNSDTATVKIDDTALLTDGDKVSDAGAWPATGVQLIQNLDPTNADVNPNVDLTLNLGEVTSVGVVVLNFYHDYNAMIGLPKGNRVVLSYSADGKTFERLGNYAINGEAAKGTYGTVETAIDIPDVEAQYINVSFDFGPSPSDDTDFDEKPVWEFIGMSEFGVVGTESGVVYGEEEPNTAGEVTNVALNKPWSGIDYHANVSGYSGDFTDGVIEEGEFSYPDATWFSFYRNGAEGNIDENYYGEVIIDLGEDGTGLGGIRMQIAPLSDWQAEWIKVYASNNGYVWEQVGELSYEGNAIQWISTTFDKTLDAQYIKVGIQNEGMFFMVSEIEVLQYEPLADESEPETSEPETSEPETSEPETSEPETSEPETSEPETSEPETSEPETSEPETSEPADESESETSEEASEPETSEEESVAESATEGGADESGTAGGESEDASTADESEAPDTGDSSTALYIAIALVMMGASVVVIRRRRA